MFGLFKRSNDPLATIQSNLPLEDQIRHVRIVVIDDQPEGFPLQVLRDMGYSIDHWDDVRDLQALQSGRYHIIILDIGGIGHGLDPVNEGAAVLSHLKKASPAQVVIAYSGQSHNPERIEFFKSADDFVRKSASVLEWKQSIDRAIQERLSPGHLWSVARSLRLARGLDMGTVQKIEREVQQARGADVAPELGKKYLRGVDDSLTIVGILAKVIKLLSL